MNQDVPGATFVPAMVPHRSSNVQDTVKEDLHSQELYTVSMIAARATVVKCTLADADREHILETWEQTGWLIGGQDGTANRLGLPRTTLIYKMRKLGIETRRSPGARPIRQAADEQCYAAANC
jgi:transcriptional regulator with GAF, ATPase, and Fis domain